MTERASDADLYFLSEETAEKKSFWSPMPERDASSTRIWIITFADLVSLLLTFFIMLYAMSSISVEKWSKVADNTETGQTEIEPGSENVASSKYALADLLYRRAVDLRYLQAVLEESLQSDAELQGVTLSLRDNRLEIELPVGILFESGQTTIEPQGEKVLFNLGGVLRNISNRINVTSYVSSAAIRQNETSEWGLSLARASAVAGGLQKAGYNRSMNIVGAVDDSPEAKGPYVTIVILPGLAGG